MSTAAGGRPNDLAWASVHLHHAGDVYGPVSDRVILDLAVPLARALVKEGCAERYFFVRYGEDGAHVRLRLQGEARVLGARIADGFDRLMAASRLADDIGPVELRRVPYVPETERYGGPRGVAVAERLSHASSEAVAELLRLPAARDLSARSGTAVLAMAGLVHGMLGEAGRSAIFLRRFQDGYLRAFLSDDHRIAEWREDFDAAFERQAAGLEPFVAEAWRRLDAGEELSPALDRYYEGAVRARLDLLALAARGELVGARGSETEERQPPARFLSSYLHMTNNRLGIPTHEEAYLAHLLARALEALDVEGAVEVAR